MMHSLAHWVSDILIVTPSLPILNILLILSIFLFRLNERLVNFLQQP